MQIEEIIIEYLRPELFVLIPVLYLLGIALKKAEFIQDKFIPLILGAFGIILAFVYLLATCGWSLNLVWVSFAQGILATAGSVYINQIYKQLTKK